MKRIFIKDKTKEEESDIGDEAAEGDLPEKPYIPNKTYLDALNQFLKPDEKPPRLIE